MSLPDIEEFLTEEPLYAKISISKEDMPWIERLLGENLRIDGYCPSCKKVSTFQSQELKHDLESNIPGEIKIDEKNKYISFKESFRKFSRVFECARDEKHLMNYDFIVQNQSNEKDTLIKVGQYPSPIDLQQLHNKEYKEKIEEILGPEKAEEYKRAIMAYGHNFGIGAFVYLRRLFESLIADSFERNKDQIETGIEEFKQKKMKDKIAILHDFLPDIVNENKHLYDVLSKGVHELGKNECLSNFTVVRGVIEYIINEVYREIKRENERAKLEKQLNEIHSDATDLT